MLVEALLDAGEKVGSREAVAEDARRLTYRQLIALACVIRKEIENGTAGPRVGIMLPATGAFSATLFGALWAGRVAVPLNFLLSVDELAAIVRDAGLDLIVSIRHFRDALTALPARSIALEDLPLRRKTMVQMLRRTPPPPSVQPEDTAVLLYTSGTTATPRGVELTQRNLRTNCDACIEATKITSEHTLLNVLPPFHVFGLTANVLVPVVLQTCVYAIPRFSPRAVLETIPRERISVFMAIPSMWGALLRDRTASPRALDTLYLAVSGGEPLPDVVAEGMRRRFGVELVQGYGLTETSPVVCLCTPETNRPGTVGRAVPGTEIRTVDDAGHDTPTGTDGEVWVRGPGVMKGYYKHPEATAEVMTPDGWFRTGDVGRLDVDGYLTITGRQKEMMIVGGENVFPAEIESVLTRHPAVAEAAVIGAADKSRGEVPVAYVISQDGATVSEVDLRSFARERLAGYKVPRRVIIAADLPRGPTGKILKRKLREAKE